MNVEKVNKFSLPVGTAHSRMADIRKYLAERNIDLQDRFIKIDGVSCKEYWIALEDIFALEKGIEVLPKKWVMQHDLRKLGFLQLAQYGLSFVMCSQFWCISIEEDIVEFSQGKAKIQLNISSLKELKQFIKAVKQK